MARKPYIPDDPSTLFDFELGDVHPVPLTSIPLADGSEHPSTADKVAERASAYLAVDVRQELQHILHATARPSGGAAHISSRALCSCWFHATAHHMANLQVRNISDGLHDRLRHHARENNCTISAAVLTAVEREVARWECLQVS